MSEAEFSAHDVSKVKLNAPYVSAVELCARCVEFI